MASMTGVIQLKQVCAAAGKTQKKFVVAAESCKGFYICHLVTRQTVNRKLSEWIVGMLFAITSLENSIYAEHNILLSSFCKGHFSNAF